MRVGIIGGGINGLCCAWVCAQAGHKVHLYERGKLANETSRASSKLLHGGLRYLEQYEFRLVREALRERDAWLERVPELTETLRLVIPIYRRVRRGRWLIGSGLFLYDRLAGKSILPSACWIGPEELMQRDPHLLSEGLIGGYEYSDGQMDDHRLALWVAEQARQLGANLYEQMEVSKLDANGTIQAGSYRIEYDRLINVTGPWATALLEKSGLSTDYKLDTVRGSHLLLRRECPQAYLLEIPDERRIFFVLPWQGSTLAGTTEVRQRLTDPITVSIEEEHYLLRAYGHYFPKQNGAELVTERYAGLRPLLYSASDPGKATREYAIERKGKLINVFGGKWTTAHALARKVANQLQ